MTFNKVFFLRQLYIRVGPKGLLEREIDAHLRDGYKDFPAAQGKMGRNGQPISKNQSSDNAIAFNLLYV